MDYPTFLNNLTIQIGYTIGFGKRKNGAGDYDDYWPMVAYVYDNDKPKIIYWEEIGEFTKNPFKSE